MPPLHRRYRAAGGVYAMAAEVDRSYAVLQAAVTFVWYRATRQVMQAAGCPVVLVYPRQP